MGLQIPDPRFKSGRRLHFFYFRPDGGTGRRTGLKILRGLPLVPVRFRFRAPVIQGLHIVGGSFFVRLFSKMVNRKGTDPLHKGAGSPQQATSPERIPDQILPYPGIHCSECRLVCPQEFIASPICPGIPSGKRTGISDAADCFSSVYCFLCVPAWVPRARDGEIQL